MVRMVLVALFSLVSLDASAVVRYMIEGMTCAQVQEAVQRDGVAILYRKGKSGAVLYDRYVRNGALCATGFSSAREGVSAADTDDCQVIKCIETNRFGD